MIHEIGKIMDYEVREVRHNRKFNKLKIEHKDYCPRCRKRTPHIKHSNKKLCKHCGYIEKY